MSDMSREMETVVLLPRRNRDAMVMNVAGLPLLKRTFRILKRGGVQKVTIVGADNDSRPAAWARESNLELQSVSSWQASFPTALLVSADLALQHDYLSRFLSLCQNRSSGPRAWSTAACGTGVIFLNAPLSGTYSDIEEVHQRLGDSNGIPLERVEVEGVCMQITDRQSARSFHRRIEETMIKPTDGIFALWNRRISLPLSRLLVLTPITPNGVSYLTLLISLAAGYLLSRGEYLEMLLGAILVQASSILDGNDGELARLRIEDSDYGTWIDTICDYLSYFLTFGGVGIGLYRSSGSSLYLLLTAILFFSFAAGMILISRMRRRYTAKAGAGAFKSVVMDSLDRRGKENIWVWLSRHLSTFATRATFSYFVLLFGIFNAWKILFGLSFLGSQLFLIAVLYNDPLLKRELK